MRRIARPGGPLARRLDLAGAARTPPTLLEAVNDGRITRRPAQASRRPAPQTSRHRPGQRPETRTFPPDVADRARAAAALAALAARSLLAVLLLVLALRARRPRGCCARVIGRGRRARPRGSCYWRAACRTVDEALGPDLDEPASIDHLRARSRFRLRRRRGRERRPARSAVSRAGQRGRPTRFKAALRDWAASRPAGRGRRPRDAPTDARPGASPRRRREALQADAPRSRARLLATATLAPHVRATSSPRSSTRSSTTRASTCRCTARSRSSATSCSSPTSTSSSANTVVALETNQDFIEAYMVGVNSRVLARAALARVPDRPARHLLPPVLGRRAATSTRRSADAEPCGRSSTTSPTIHTLAARVQARRARQPAARPGRAERNEIVLVDPRRAAQEVPEHRHLRPRRRSGSRRPTAPSTRPRSASSSSSSDAELDQRRPAPRSGRRSTRPRSTPTSTSSASTSTPRRRKGGTGDNPSDPPGWFFVLKERPGEPRFGFDDARAADDPIVTVNDLAWTDTGVAPGRTAQRRDARRPSPWRPPASTTRRRKTSTTTT